MPLVVPLLRLAMLFLNVYDTFKTLKPPSLSARTGKVSVRAASQRKRDMKGILAVWIVWACFATYERTVDGMIRFFIPFYDEIKSLLIIFLILSRARGAEPIYLHVIRPLVKPYVVTLDAILDVVHGVGDLLLLASRVPVQVISSWWNERLGFHEAGTPAVGFERAPDPPAPPEIQGYRTTPSSSSIQPSSSDLGNQPRPSLHRLPQSAFSDVNPGQTSSMRSPPAYEIWHPPPPAYEDSMGSNAMSHIPSTSTAPVISGLPTSGTSDNAWRQYPAFPSAYPVTPAPQPKPIPLADAPPSIAALFPVILEDEALGDATPLKKEMRSRPQPTTAPEWDFERSLQNRPEHLNPSSEPDWSDNDPMTGVQAGNDDADDARSEEVAMAIDSSDEEIEDDFDVTLRTPPPRPPPRRRFRSPRNSGEAASRPVSIAVDSRSTSLTTVGNRLSEIPNSAEESSISSSENAPPPLAGAKRPLARPDRNEIPKRTRVLAASGVANTKNASAPAARSRKLMSAPTLRSVYSGDASDERTMDERDTEITDVETKRPRALRGSQRTARSPVSSRQAAVADKGVRVQDKQRRTQAPLRAALPRAARQPRAASKSSTVSTRRNPA